MSILKVLRAGHPLLRDGGMDLSADFLKSNVFDRLLSNMFETMHDHDGVGLAGPQIQVPKNVFIFEIGQSDRYEVDESIPPTVFVNPSIIDYGGNQTIDWEGCLSFPNLRGKVPRYDWVLIRGLDESGNSVEKRYEGFPARVIQHEFDHLQGQLFPDRMKDLQSLSYEEEYHRYHAEPQDSE